MSLEQKRRVLLIAYYFPPCGMGGVQRAVKFAKYLPQFGWTVTVLTVKGIAYYQKDETLLNDIRSAGIERTGSLDPLRIKYILSGRSAKQKSNLKSGAIARLFRSLEPWLFVPDSKKLWIPFAFIRAAQIITRNNIQAILSTAPPFSSHLLAMLLARTFHLPWIADFRDGWTNNDFLHPHGRPYSFLHRYLEKAVVKNSGKVSGISHNIVNYLQQKDPDKKDKFVLLYNGFDDEDINVKTGKTEKFTLTMLGAVTEWADPSVFLPAISNAVERNPAVRGFLSIKIIGNIMYKPFIDMVKSSPIKECISFAGYLPHREALVQLMNSDALLFPVTKPDAPGIITGKLFEYLASGKPIIAFTPDGEARDILTRFCDESFFYDGLHDEALGDFILKKFSYWRENTSIQYNNGIKTEPFLREKLQVFSRKDQARTMAGLLKEITSA